MSCHHMAALMIWAEKNLTRTDMPCQWTKATNGSDDIESKEVGLMWPDDTTNGDQVLNIDV